MPGLLSRLEHPVWGERVGVCGTWHGERGHHGDVPAVTLPLTVREPRPDEWAFIFAGWVRSAGGSAPSRVFEDAAGKLRTRRMGRRAWEYALSARIEGLRRRATFRVAEAEGALVGFVCCASDWVLHYLYVDPKFRRAGVARQLLAHQGIVAACDVRFTGWTPFVERLPVPRHWEWDESPLERGR